MPDVDFSVSIRMDKDGQLSGRVRGSMFSHMKQDGSETHCSCAVDVDPDKLEQFREGIASLVADKAKFLGDQVEDERAHIRKLARGQRELAGQEA